MNNEQSLSHTKWECKYHLTWIPKYRKKQIFEDMRKYLGEVFKELARRRECEVLEGHLRPRSCAHAGRDRTDEGLEAAEKAVVAYGGVQMGQLEKNVSWISLFIALAPMLGFMGTVIGMIAAFDSIQAAGDISPTVVAGGIKMALLTTVFGLIAAIILQIFYNYIISKVDGLVNDMEDSTISFIDILAKNK